MLVRSKMKCRSVTYSAGGYCEVELLPVMTGSPENDRYFKATPGGTLKLCGVKSEIGDLFKPDREYYIDVEDAAMEAMDGKPSA